MGLPMSGPGKHRPAALLAAAAELVLAACGGGSGSSSSGGAVKEGGVFRLALLHQDAPRPELRVVLPPLGV
jgi:hypothetical protein